jgi:hypothetical protein
MSLTMLVSFITVRLSPETLNRDLTDPNDAGREGHGAPDPVVVADLAATQPVK